MNIYRSSTVFSVKRFVGCVLVLVIMGLCQFAASASTPLKKHPGRINTANIQIAPKNNHVRLQVPRAGNIGISGTLMCNQVTRDSYDQYGGIYLNEGYTWSWQTPASISYESTQTILTYNMSGGNPYFYFQRLDDASPLEAVKIYLDTNRTNNATIEGLYYEFDTGNLYYTDTQVITDYQNGIIYWYPDTTYENDNIFFYISSGEINVIGFEIYSQGYTPSDFMTSGPVTESVAAPVFRPASCDFTDPITIEILSEEGTDIYFSTDGYTPTVSEQNKYNGPIVISSTTTFNAIATDSEGNSSRVSTATYTCIRHGIGEGYNPTSPGNPGVGSATQDKTYRLTLVANPSGAGSVNAYSYNLKAGEQTYVYTYNYTGFKFKNWTIEDTEVSETTSFYYLMPDHDVTIVANYTYDPASPGNPSPLEQIVKHPAVIRGIPSGVATFSPSGTFDMEENTVRAIYAYPKSGWKLAGWTVNGEEQQQITSPLTITMREKALDIAAYFIYDPTPPSNPAANYYNPSTGQVIIDDFTPGYLYSALQTLLGYGNYYNVSSLIIKGEMTPNDLGVLYNFSNTGTIDLSRIGGISSIPSYTFESTSVSSILLPSTISSIGSYAFSGCANLSSLTIYAQEPPECSSYTFSGFTNKANCTVFVPASAIELYSTAPYWKDFTILPISNDAHVLQVNLPEDASDGRYKNNTLEIVNINSGVRQKYVISDRQLYTFNGLQKDEQYNIYMFSQAGLEIGRIENVVIPDRDIEVTFDNLRSLHTVFAKILGSENVDVTSQVTVEWLKPLADGNVTYMRKGASLGEIPEGQQLICRVSLDNKLGVVYTNPEDVEFTVGSGNNICTVNLVPFRSIELSGTVVDGDGTVLSGASVSANQTLNGKYSKTYTARTDRKGLWTLTVLDAPETRLIYAANECVNVNDTIGAFAAEINTLDLGKTMMKSIVGARVTYGFTYHAAGSEDIQNYYSDYQNVLVDVFNVTQNRAHKDISHQYPILAILDENINVGDELKLTATSKTGAFNPIVETVTVGEDQRADVTFDIVGKGGISASFEMTDNPAVTAMLYSDKGELLKKQTYSEAKAKFTELQDGDYTLVTMGQSDLMNSILRLSNFAEIGLTEGKDYVKNYVKVESGKLAEVKNSEIPAFDESLFYYTNSNTSFSSNKSSVTTGNYLTLRSAIDFKGVYKNDISNVALVVDLPEACEFVEQSVIQGPNLLPYTLDNNRLTVQLGNNYQSQTRFCVIPTAGGSFNASASIVFDYNGKTVNQPIGSAFSEIKNLDFIVPTTINSEKFQVNGIAPGGSLINVYEDGNLIGNARALANGTWTAECLIPQTYNFTTHTIYAIITTKDGIVLKSESVMIDLDRSCASPKSVLMSFYNGWLHKNVDVIFDFTNLTIDNPGYMFYTKTNLTFVADFTDNSPEHLSDVILWTLASNNTETPIRMSYNSATDKWIGSQDFDYYTAPVNLTLEYSYDGQKLYDRKQFSDFIEERESILADNIAEREEFITEFDAQISKDEITERLAELFAQEEPDENEIRRLLNMSDQSDDVTYVGMSDEEFDALCQQAEISWKEWDENVRPVLRETVLTDYFADPEYDLLSDYEISSELEDGIKTVSKEKISSINRDELEAIGYTAITLDDGSEIYVFYSENLMEVIDCGQYVKYRIAIESQTSSALTSRTNIPVMPGSYMLYATAAKNAVQAIYSLSNTDSRRWLVEVANKIHEATEGISKFYELFMSDFNQMVFEAYNRLQILCDNDLEDQQALAEAAEERIKEYTKKIEANKSQRSFLELERKGVATSPVISEQEKAKLLQEYDEKIQKLTDENKHLNGKRAGSNTQLNRANTKITEIKAKSSKFRKVHTQIRESIDKLPKRLTRGLKMPKVLRFCGKVAGELGLPLQCWSLFNDMIDMADDISQWLPIMDNIDVHRCYKKGEPDAVNLHNLIYDSANGHAWQNVGILSSEIGAIGFSIAGGVPGSPTWWGELGLSVFAECWKHFNDKSSCNERSKFGQQIDALKCDDKDDDKKPNPDKKKHNYPFNPANPIHDPSGYVYEAVPENRVEGVQATIYYKETKEDMYGDPYEDIVLWDAEEYAQENPLFTDENGMYRWDVPQGLWQVKFEKDGYVTAYSEWLPVPPPQLEVNIGIVQNKQPEVIEARAYEEGIEVQFDKYMDLSTLTTGNIFVTANGEKLNGEILFVDSELADEYASEEDANALRYASRVRFVPEEKLSSTTGEIRVTVSRNVLSYAGIPMTETFSQVLDVEKEVQVVYADDVKVLYGGEKEVTVYALPYDAAVGRKLHIANSSDLIASIDTTEATLDEEGKAVVTVKGELPGRTQLTFTIDDVTATGECAVDVVTEIITAEAPKSSRASGTAVYRGTKVELSTDSKNATIYFTTDGSCPCDENGTRRKYTVPIVINDDTQILAMTSVGNGNDDVSETVQFNYTLKRSDMDFRMEEGWTWISHNLETAIAPADLADDEAITRILSQTKEVIRDPQLGMIGTLGELQASESYKIESDSSTDRKRFSDIAWNPSTPIAINSGWNWLGYPVSQTMTVDEAFATTKAETLDIVVGQNGFAQYDGENWIGTLEIMTPGMGYMYQSQSPKNVVYNTSIVSTASAKYATGISESLPLVLDIHKYGVIMPVTATLHDLDGSLLDSEDYQVAAFCGTECRGIGRIVKGLVMMNVYGNVNDPITFHVTDADGKNSFDNNASLNFSERVVGDIFNPYTITINKQSGISDVKYDGNVKVTVEGDMLRIKGISANDIDLVEIYDYNGQKLIHETNVSESGIRISTLANGMYVVIVKGNGEYSYHRVAVR